MASKTDVTDCQQRARRGPSDAQAKETKQDPLCTSPYSNVNVGRIQMTSPVPVSPRHSLSAHKRPKQKVRKPSKEFLSTKSGPSFDQIDRVECVRSRSCRRIRTEYRRCLLVEEGRRSSLQRSRSHSLPEATDIDQSVLGTENTHSVHASHSHAAHSDAHEPDENKSLESHGTPNAFTQFPLEKHPHSGDVLCGK